MLIVGHPLAKQWPLRDNQTRIVIEFFRPAPNIGNVFDPAYTVPPTRVLFTCRKVILNDGTLEFLAPVDWTDLEAIFCAFTGEQPKGKEVYDENDVIE